MTKSLAPGQRIHDRRRGYLLDVLKHQGTYHAYMQSSFSGLTVKQEVMSNAFSQIHRAGDFISTTNYDLLLEQATSAETVTYTDPRQDFANAARRSTTADHPFARRL